jgi:hypothetical protein
MKSYLHILRFAQQGFTIMFLLCCLLLVHQTAAKNSPVSTMPPPPGWSVNPDDFEFNMNAIIRVRFSGTPSNNTGNLVGAFVGNELRGVAIPKLINGESFFFLTIYSNEYHGETVHFKVYYAPNDAVYGVGEETVFIHNLIIGTTESPFWLDINPNQDFPPELSPILNDTTLQTIPFDPINLVNYLFSADGDPVIWSAQPGPNLTVSLVNGVLTVTPVSNAWIGTDTVRIIVRENTANQLADTVTARFTVLFDYGPPVWQTIPNQTIFQGQQFTAFGLDNYLTFNGPCRNFDYDVFPFTGTAADPAWPTVTPGNQPMNVVARPLFADVRLAGAGAKLAAFVNGNLAGWAAPTGVAPNVSYNLVLKNVGAGPISFQFYDAAPHYLYTENTNLQYVAGGSVGTIASPYQIQLSPLVPTLAANGQFSVAIDDPTWLGAYPINFIAWDCNYPLLRRDTTQAVFTITNDIRPIISSPNTVNFEENACSTLYDTQTTDPNNSEGAGLTYSLVGGADVGRFSINPVTGILNWATGFSPDFESPADANTDNQYEVNIQVANSANLKDTLYLIVTITNQAVEPFAAQINGGVSLLCLTGNVNLQATGGVSYVWSTGATTAAIVVSTSGTYTVTATSSGACTATASVVVSPPPTIIAAGNNGTVCLGSTIQLSSTPTGGTPSYTNFTWAGPNGYSATVEDPPTFPATALSAGTYTVTVTDSPGCTATATKIISVSANAAPTITASANSPVCLGSTIQLSSTPNGGSGTFTQFSWAGPNSFASPSQNPSGFSATLAATGTYTVTVTDNSGCSGTGTTSVTVKPSPSITAAVNSPICVGGTVLLTATPSGGSGMYAQYNWAGPNNFSANVQNPPGFSATLAAAGTYSVTVTDDTGCTAKGTTTLSINGLPGITATVLGPVCTGGSVTLRSTPTGGSGQYASFQWSGPNGYSANVEDPAAFPVTPLVAGNYTVTVTDVAGCSATGSVTVVVNAVPSISAMNNGPVCEGADITLSSTPSGGSGIYSLFQWTGPDFYIATVEDPAPFSTAASSAGIYQVKVTDSKGCTAIGTTNVVVNTQPVIVASSNSPLCLGANLNLQSTPSGGAGVYATFNWTGPNNYSATVEDPAGFPVNLVNSGTYSVTVTDYAGCTATASTSVSVSTLNAPSITATSNSPLCGGSNLNLNSTPSGGSGIFTTFAWAGPNNYASTMEDPSPFPVFAPGGAGIYSVTVTDSKNCKGTASVTVTVDGPIATPTSNSPVCPNGTILLNGGPILSGTVTYAWSGPNNYTSNQRIPPGFSAIPAAAGTYSLAITQNGCSSIGTVTVTTGDVTPPTITCPANVTIAANASCAGLVGAYAPATLSDNCNANPTVTQSPAAITALNGHNDFETVTLTANDGNGNTANCNFTVTLKDVTPPIITCPANVTIAANTSCAGVVGAYAPATLGDNCNANPTVTQSPAANTALNGHNDFETVTLTANDGNGNTATCSFTVTLKDVTPPSITCPANVTIAANTSCAGVVGAYTPTSMGDNCNANPTVTQSPSANTALNGHNDAKTVTFTANDGNGNTATCSFTIILKDVTAPSITCPANVTIAANTSCAGVVGAYTPTSMGDNCNANPTVTQSPSANTALNGHNDAKTVTFTANDGNGNTATCSFTVTLKDVTPPTITCPANVTIAANTSCAGVVGAYAPATLSDNCNANPTVTQSPASITALNGHNDFETVTLTANDGNGNTASCTLTVTLKDVTAPSITCPANVTIAANANCSGAVGAYTPATLSDNCNPNPSVVQSPVASTPLNGHNDFGIVTLLASDGNGNSQLCTFTVTLKDVTPPTITCPANVTIAANASCSGVVGAYTPVSVGDNCNANPTVTQSPPPGTALNGHNDSKTVTLTANDGNGNTTSCTFTVTLKDITPPTITCPANVTIAANTNCGGVVGSYAAVSIGDNCNPNPTVTQSPAPSTTLSGHNDSKTVTLTANDGNGNTTSCTFTVTLKDVTPPTIVCKPFTTPLNAAGTTSIVPANVFQSGADNCGTVNLLSVTPNSFTCSNLGANTVTLTANDGNGNTSTCNAVVTVVDLIPPTMVCKNITIKLNGAGTTTITPAQVNNGSTDNCSLVNLTVTPSVFTCAVIGSNTVTLNGTDQSGNSAGCASIVTVLDTIAPTMICQNAVLNLNSAGQATLTVAQVNNGSFDNCSIATLSLSQTAFNCANLGNNTVTLTGADQSGNSATCTATVLVRDLIAPVAKCKNAIANLNASGNVTVLPAAVDNSSTDNCSFTLTLSPNTFSCANLGLNTVTLRATDGSGNSSTCSATVTVKDVTTPTALCKNLTIFLDGVGKAGITVAQVDNGSFDNCSITNRSLSLTQFNCSDISAPVNVFFTVTDQSGNTRSCTAVITVKDNIAPTAICTNVTVALAGGSVTVYSANLAGNSTDNCSIWSYTPVAKTYTSANIGPNNLLITVKDWSGNAATCTSVVTVLPNSPDQRPENPKHDTLPSSDKSGLRMLVYPNPTAGDALLYFELESDQTFVLRVYDRSGQVVFSQQAMGEEGGNSVLLRQDLFLPGLYFIQLQANGKNGQKRLMFQR